MWWKSREGLTKSGYQYVRNLLLIGTPNITRVYSDGLRPHQPRPRPQTKELTPSDDIDTNYTRTISTSYHNHEKLHSHGTEDTETSRGEGIQPDTTEEDDTDECSESTTRRREQEERLRPHGQRFPSRSAGVNLPRISSSRMIYATDQRGKMVSRERAHRSTCTPR